MIPTLWEKPWPGLELVRSTQIAPERPVRVVKSVVCTVRYVLRPDVSNTHSCADIPSVLRLHKPPASPCSHASRARGQVPRSRCMQAGISAIAVALSISSNDCWRTRQHAQHVTMFHAGGAAMIRARCGVTAVKANLVSARAFCCSERGGWPSLDHPPSAERMRTF